MCTGGCLAKALEFWFEFWDKDLRERYRKVYERVPTTSPDFPKRNPRNRETWMLTATVCNRDIDLHVDDSDWKGGLTALSRFNSTLMDFGLLAPLFSAILGDCKGKNYQIGAQNTGQ